MKNAITEEIVSMSLIMFVGLILAGLLVTGTIPPIRNLALPMPEEPCNGKEGQAVRITGLDGTWYAKRDAKSRLNPCILEPDEESQTAFKGVWANGGEAEITARPLLTGTHSGMKSGGAGYLTTLSAITLGSLLISAVYAAFLIRRNRHNEKRLQASSK